jgi:hypothetical protein
MADNSPEPIPTVPTKTEDEEESHGPGAEDAAWWGKPIPLPGAQTEQPDRSDADDSSWWGKAVPLPEVKWRGDDIEDDSVFLFLDGGHRPRKAHYTRITGIHFLPDITDDDLAQLRNYPNLAYLRIGEARLTKAGFAHLRALSSLDTLELLNPRTEDDPTEYIDGLTKLRYLALVQCPITDVLGTPWSWHRFWQPGIASHLLPAGQAGTVAEPASRRLAPPGGKTRGRGTHGS